VVNRDYRDLFAEFNDRNVEFLIVGAYALADVEALSEVSGGDTTSDR
jgi:hypothetical protein